MPKPDRVVVFRIGQLGDILVSIPAIAAIRRHFPQSQIGILSDCHPAKGYVGTSDVLQGSGLVDYSIEYSPPALMKVGAIRQGVSLIWRLRKDGVGTLVYLAPSRRSPAQVRRDRVAFWLAGIRNVIGMDGLTPLPGRGSDGLLPVLPKESDLLLGRLSRAGIRADGFQPCGPILNIGEIEARGVDRWLGRMPPDGGRRWLAVSPASKMPIKRWPVDRYEETVRALISSHDTWPVIFGGPEDSSLAQYLIGRWGRGYAAAGCLSVRESMAALARCVLYVGNDTGVMHMAAAMGVKCVAVFTSRDYPGVWYPPGQGHVVLCKRTPCEGCMEMVDCRYGRRCILSISVKDVVTACCALLGSTARKADDQSFPRRAAAGLVRAKESPWQSRR